MMSKTLLALAAALVLAGPARAAGEAGSPGKGGSGATSEESRAMQQEMAKAHQIMGRVVEVRDDNVFIEARGVVIPLKLTQETRLMGSTATSEDELKRRAQDELKAGEMVRANFKVQNKTDNVATSLAAEAQQPSK